MDGRKGGAKDKRERVGEESEERIEKEGRQRGGRKVGKAKEKFHAEENLERKGREGKAEKGKKAWAGKERESVGIPSLLA